MASCLATPTMLAREFSRYFSDAGVDSVVVNAHYSLELDGVEVRLSKAGYFMDILVPNADLIRSLNDILCKHGRAINEFRTTIPLLPTWHNPHADALSG